MLAMHLPCVLAFLVCAVHGQPVQNSTNRTNGAPSNQLKGLELLLLALNPAVSFNPSHAATHFPRRAPTLRARQGSPRLVDQDLWDYYYGTGGPDVQDAEGWYHAQCEAEPPSDSDELMNYGMYTDPLHPGAVHHPQAHMANMYCQLVDGTNITGRRVLEVGSGRGGGARILQSFHQPAMYVGLDLVASQVASANKRLSTFGPSSLVFVQGNACELPFPDNSFDVVVNVESSHNYQPFRRFLDEVRRVVVPNGEFLIEDFRGTEDELGEMHQEILDVFGTDMQVYDISANVQTSLDMNADYIQQRITQCEKFASRRHCEGYWLYGGRDPTRMWKIRVRKPS